MRNKIEMSYRKNKTTIFEHRVILSLFNSFKFLLKSLGSIFLKRRKTNFYFAKWGEVYSKARSASLEGRRVALLKADRLLENILSELGANGRTFAEKLKNSRIFFETEDAYNSAWQAHRIRNHFAHAERELSASEVSEALFCFDKAFRGLKIIK